MRRHLIAAVITLTATSTLSAQTCRTVIRSYPATIQSRVAYLPATQITFGRKQHLPELATRLYEQSNAICWEMHHRYQGNLEFHETYAEMYKILQDTKHVFDLINRNAVVGGDEDHIATDLHEMDALFHHIEDDVARWRPTNRYHYHSRAGLSSKMAYFEETLHHLMEDYGVRSRLGVEAPAPVQSTPAPAPTVPLPPTRYQTTPPSLGSPSASRVLPVPNVPLGNVVRSTYRNQVVHGR